MSQEQPANQDMTNRVTARTKALIHQSFDSVISADELRELEQALEASADTRRYYLRLAQMEVDISLHLQGQQTYRNAMEEAGNATPSNSSPRSDMLAVDDSSESANQGSFLAGMLNSFASPYAISAMLLGVLVGGLISLSWAPHLLSSNRSTVASISDRQFVPEDVIARVGATHNANWESADMTRTIPTRYVRSGQQIRLDEGRLDLQFNSGIGVMIEGPAVFEVTSSRKGKLYSGKIATTGSSTDPFWIETPQGLISLDEGQIAVQADNDLNVQVHSIMGSHTFEVSSNHMTAGTSRVRIEEGHALSLSSTGLHKTTATDRSLRQLGPIEPASGRPYMSDTIWLGNLFDDGTSTSLTDAMLSDTYGAAAEPIDLGIAAVRDGALDVDFQVAERGVRFNLANIGGGGPAVNGLPANDTYRSVSSEPIRTIGTLMPPNYPQEKVEEGIGMSANEMLTFDLKEIRSAGQLETHAMRFVVDRSGLNDTMNSAIGDARVVVIVSTESGVLSAYVNGQKSPFTEVSGVYRFDPEVRLHTPPLKSDGIYVNFDVPVPPNARYLTLATLMCKAQHGDHTVFSGARLEIIRKPELNTTAQSPLGQPTLPLREFSPSNIRFF